MNEIKMSEWQAFWLWMLCAESEKTAPRGVMTKLWKCFGGEKSELYQEWNKTR